MKSVASLLDHNNLNDKKASFNMCNHVLENCLRPHRLINKTNHEDEPGQITRRLGVGVFDIKTEGLPVISALLLIKYCGHKSYFVVLKSQLGIGNTHL